MHDNTRKTASEASHAGRIAQRLNSRYAVILIAVAMLLGLDLALLQPQFTQLSTVAPRINTAGRQRMLSQKLVKEALALQDSADNSESAHWRRQLQETLKTWRESHRELADDAERSRPFNESESIRDGFTELETRFQAMSQEAATLLAVEGVDASTARLLKHEAEYLPRMDHIVSLYEAEAQRQAQTLRAWRLIAAASVLLLIASLGILVLRPASRTIQRQMDTLDHRIALRTSELTQTNDSLRREMQIREGTERRNRELADQLAHASRVRSLSQLATGLAHEINQPLGAISNYSETCEVLLRRSSPDIGSIRQTVAAIGKAACRAGQIIRNMRNFLRPGQETPREVSLTALVDEVVLLCQPELRRRQIEIELDLGAELSPLFVAPVQIQQVLINLIQNSMEAMQGTPLEKRRLRITARRLGNFAEVEVADSGCGFGDRKPEALFEPFLTTKDSGLGMGLALVRSIVHAHGGCVQAENREPGAAVSFTIPLDSQHERFVATKADCLCS